MIGYDTTPQKKVFTKKLVVSTKKCTRRESNPDIVIGKCKTVHWNAWM